MSVAEAVLKNHSDLRNFASTCASARCEFAIIIGGGLSSYSSLAWFLSCVPSKLYISVARRSSPI